jgi:hypothetical protein
MVSFTDDSSRELTDSEYLGLRSIGFNVKIDPDDTFGTALKKYRKQEVDAGALG